MSFDIFGPFNLPDLESLSSNSAATNFEHLWSQVEARQPGLASAYGCFLFLLLNRGRTMPWIIGGSTEQPFVESCTAPPVQKRYRKVLRNFPDATPQLMLLPYSAEPDAYAKPRRSERMDIWWMRTVLTGICFSRNPELLENSRSSYRHCTAVGRLIQARDKATIDQRALRTALGMS